MPLTLYYWGIKSRNLAPIAIAQAGSLELIQETNPDLAGLKPELPFGQLPYLVDGDVTLAQSGAIVRYLARKAGLQGDNDADFAMSEQLIEEMQDINSLYIKAHYSADRVKAFDELFQHGSDSPLFKQLHYLENLLLNDKHSFGSKFCAGDYCIAAVLNLGISLEPSLLSSYPKLSKFYDNLINSSAFDNVKDYGDYYARTPKEA